jgi:hypothetical protein
MEEGKKWRIINGQSVYYPERFRTKVVREVTARKKLTRFRS